MCVYRQCFGFAQHWIASALEASTIQSLSSIVGHESLPTRYSQPGTWLLMRETEVPQLGVCNLSIVEMDRLSEPS